jgi:renalase
MKSGIVIGAGISGLTVARGLAHFGYDITLIEKARGVGGRCATRRVNDEFVDHGVPFVHGETDRFRSLLDKMSPEKKSLDWPFHLQGKGTPCQPHAFRNKSFRFAFKEGMTVLPKHLARSLNVKLKARVENFEINNEHFVLRLENEEITAPLLVLTCPIPQTLELLKPLLAGDMEPQAIARVLDQICLLPCLTVLAGFDRASSDLWHLWWPGPESPIHSLINNSSKRDKQGQQSIVIQASPAYSRYFLEASSETWTPVLLKEASKWIGSWAEHPSWIQTHVWRYARVQRGDELKHPLFFQFKNGPTLGLCGEAFHPLGGLEGAFLSGQEMVARIAGQTATEIAENAPMGEK